MELKAWLHRAFEDNAKIYGPNRREPIMTPFEVMFLGRVGVAYVTRKQPKGFSGQFYPCGTGGAMEWRPN